MDITSLTSPGASFNTSILLLSTLVLSSLGLKVDNTIDGRFEITSGDCSRESELV